MPLVENARRIMRLNLETIRDGKKPKLITVGALTSDQLAGINEILNAEELPLIVAEVVFIGKHIYRSRITDDGYTIEDVLDQIYAAMEPTSLVVQSLKMRAMENPKPRLDRYGMWVNDRAIFECTAKHPRPELYSVIPKGDGITPEKNHLKAERAT